MRRYGWLLLCAFAACRPDAPVRRSVSKHPIDTTLTSLLRDRRDRPRDRALTTPRIVTEPAVVVFWLRATDTLSRDSAEAASRDLDYYTELVAPRLGHNDIPLLPTNVDTVYVAQPGGIQRAIVLSGLDYPYGYLLIDPGTPERILTGIYDDQALMDELDAYFDLTDERDSSGVVPRVIT